MRLLRDPDTLRKRVERLTVEQRRALRAPEREIAAYKERLASLGRKRSGHFDQQAEGLISMTELRYTLDTLNAERERIERELRRFEDRGMRLRQFKAHSNLVEGYLRDLPSLLDHAPPVRDYETVPEERTPENPLGFYSLAPGSIRHLTKEELAEKRRAAEDARGERFRAVYDDLGVRAGDHPDGTPEVGWKFGGNAKLFRTENDASLNGHATKHFRSTEHSLVEFFEPGEDWIFCYVDKVVVERR